MLESRIDVLTVGLNLKPMVDRGYLVRRAWRNDKGLGRKPAFWYARSVAALDNLERQMLASGQIQADIGRDAHPLRPSADQAVDGIGLDSEANGTVPNTEALLEPSEPFSANNGSGK